MKQEIYLSIDIEADGPIPGPYSMLQIGAAAFTTADAIHPIDTFKANLERLPGASQHPDTMSWWDSQGDAYENTRTNLVEPEVAMKDFVKWVDNLPGRVTVVGYPVTYDFMWVYWYTFQFGGVDKSPFGFQGMDLKTYAAAKLNRPFKSVTKGSMPKSWHKGVIRHTHDALDDAIGQGTLFINMLKG